MLLDRYIIYSYNDMSVLLIKFLAKYTGINSYYGNTAGPWYVENNADILTNKLVELLSSFISPVVLNNSLIVVAVLLSMLFSYKLFFHLCQTKSVAVSFSLFFTFSPYFASRVISLTQGLYFIFVFPLIFLLLLKKKHPVLIALIASLCMLLSTYYGIFIFLIVVLWYTLETLTERPFITSAVHKLKYMVVFTATFLLCIAPWYGQYISKNIPVLRGDYVKPPVSEWMSKSTLIYRPIEDYYSFSLRPWYFFIPPVNSYLFSDFSQSMYSRIKASGHYLADDYDKFEMIGTFIPWHLVIFPILALGYLMRRKQQVLNKTLILRLTLVLGVILFISLPPSIVIRGVTIFTPSYVVYHVLPIFRVLARWSVVIYLLVLLINVLLLAQIWTTANKLTRAVLLAMFLVLTFGLSLLKLPVIDVTKPPAEVAYLESVTREEKVPVLVFPEGDYSFIFWTLHHKNYLINPANFYDYTNGFNTQENKYRMVNDMQSVLEDHPKAGYLIVYLNTVDYKDLKKHSTIGTKIDLENYFTEKFGDAVFKTKEVLIYSL
ncbi:MAG: hypothetical protein RLY61_573 [Candidatus Parcubacteria bacterium]